MESVGAKLNLRETGRRYDHYMELKEVFMTGIEVIDGMMPAHRSDGDLLTRVKLEHAVEAITKRIAYLSDYDLETGMWSDFRKELREIDLTRKKKLLGGGDGNQEKESEQNSPRKDSEEPPNIVTGI